MIKTDKLLHFVVCFIIAALGALLGFGVFGLGKWVAILCGFGLSFLVGVGKEVFDKYVRKTGFDKQDLLADAAGAMMASLFAIGM